MNILASPHIMAANNQEARIMIGEEVPILTSQSMPLISQTTSFQTSTVQYRSTGIILTVKPQINAKGLVTLEIAQEVSDAKTTTTGVSGTPTFTVRQAKTSLITADNQTVVLGGLIREDNTQHPGGHSRVAQDARAGAPVRFRRGQQTENRTHSLDNPPHYF